MRHVELNYNYWLVLCFVCLLSTKKKYVDDSRLQLMLCLKHESSFSKQFVNFSHHDCASYMPTILQSTWENCHFYTRNNTVNMSWIPLAVKWAMREWTSSHAKLSRLCWSHYSSFRPIIHRIHLSLSLPPWEIITWVFICNEHVRPQESSTSHTLSLHPNQKIY